MQQPTPLRSTGCSARTGLLTGIACLVVVCAVGASGCSRSRDDGPRSIHQYPQVDYTTGGDWYEHKLEQDPDQTGWVLLPEPTADVPYDSGVDPHTLGFVKPDVCAECHQEIYESFLETAHARTAQEARPENVLGSFAQGENRLSTRDPRLAFEMVRDEHGMRQCLEVRQDAATFAHEASIDLVTGSGNHGQTYLYWQGDALFQLPVSYFSELDRWVNSPGLYTDGTADFARGIGDRCLDCHATFFALAPGTFNRYDRQNYILGVTCVRCHGSGWAHVQYHQNHRDDVQPRYIVNPALLSSERGNEVCAQCHSGAGQLRQPAFSYRPGEPLADYIALDFSGDNVENDDPHAANQLARLMKSRCFSESRDMTCHTCHDPHRQERGDLALFGSRCATCHEQTDCGLSAELGEGITNRCVPCHMPSRRDNQGIIETADGHFLPLLRDHFIQAQPDATRPIVEALRLELQRPAAAGDDR